MTLNRFIKASAVVVVLVGLGYSGNASARYLQPEPMLQNPRYVTAMAKMGLSPPTYGYANNNPINYIDSDGLKVSGTADRNDWWQRLNDVLARLNANACVHQFFQKCFGDDPFTNATLHDIHASKDNTWCGMMKGMSGHTSGLTKETILCSSMFTGKANESRELGSTIMHELAHQMAPLKTNDVPTYCGFPAPGGDCSASAAEKIGYAAMDGRDPCR